jgi:hypothetical protein
MTIPSQARPETAVETRRAAPDTRSHRPHGSGDGLIQLNSPGQDYRRIIPRFRVRGPIINALRHDADDLL